MGKGATDRYLFSCLGLCVLLASCLGASRAQGAIVPGWRAALFDELELLYLDSSASAGVQELSLDTARGVPVAVHLLLECGDAQLTLEGAEGWSAFRLLDVPVEENTGIGGRTEQFAGEVNPHVIRRAPFRIYEAFEPLTRRPGEPLRLVGEGPHALRIELPIASDALPETRALSISIEAAGQTRVLHWNVTVHDAVVPPIGPDTLGYTNWFSTAKMAELAGVELWSEEFWVVLEQYAQLMVHGRQNTFWVRWSDVFDAGDEGTIPVLNTERLRRYVSIFRKAGAHWIEGAPIARRPGNDWSMDWLELKLTGLAATGEEGRAALAAMAGSLSAVLEREGWRDSWMQHLADEPTDVNAADYRKLSEALRAALPGVRIMEATMTRELSGAIDIWCPQVQKYQAHRDFFLERKAAGDSVWTYTCLVPGGAWLNRLLDQERLRQVYIGWAAAKYGWDGYLHWGFNHYQADPFEHSVVDHPQAPGTTNKLPAGDTHIVYPGRDGPWSGQRFEAHRIGLEDNEMLRQLQARDPALAGSIIESVLRACDDYELDVASYRAAKERLLIALATGQQD